jgi:catechol 2,3-dioxygenase-like lactoylglutathione lyase family enzyme
MAVKGLIHYALEVPDPAKGEAFYRDFGLRSGESGGKALRLEAGHGAGGLLLYAGEMPLALAGIGYQCGAGVAAVGPNL